MKPILRIGQPSGMPAPTRSTFRHYPGRADLPVSPILILGEHHDVDEAFLSEKWGGAAAPPYHAGQTGRLSFL